MPKNLLIRNIDSKVHIIIKIQAIRAGKTLQDYIKDILKEHAKGGK